MSSGQCQAGDIQGFPLTISQSLNSSWPGLTRDDVYKRLKKVTVPNEYSVKWSRPTYGNMINVVKPTAENNVLQVTGFDSYAEQTTLTYGDAQYTCSYAMAIVQNQHLFFSDDSRAKFEVLLSFQLKNKNENPSAPDIILFSRPLVIYDGDNDTPLWSAIDKASSTSRPQSSTVDLSSIFTFNKTMLIPFITYQTCIPVKVITPAQTTVESLRIRVNALMRPLYLTFNSTDLSTSVRKYTLPTNPASLFSTLSLSAPTIQFKDGNGSDGFPRNTNTNLRLALPTTTISDFDSILNIIEIQVPEEFLGKSLNDIASSSVAPNTSSKKKAYKCYTIDPKKDIVDGQIMVDPTTGENLSDAQADAEDGDEIDTDIDADTGIMPGDVEYALSVTATVIGTLGLLAYLLFIILKGRNIFNTGGHTIPGGFNEVLYHILIFTMIFIGLIVFCSFIENPAEPKNDS